jgi:hypothetical protein
MATSKPEVLIVRNKENVTCRAEDQTVPKKTNPKKAIEIASA